MRADEILAVAFDTAEILARAAHECRLARDYTTRDRLMALATRIRVDADVLAAAAERATPPQANGSSAAK